MILVRSWKFLFFSEIPIRKTCYEKGYFWAIEGAKTLNSTDHPGYHWEVYRTPPPPQPQLFVDSPCLLVLFVFSGETLFIQNHLCINVCMNRDGWTRFGEFVVFVLSERQCYVPRDWVVSLTSFKNVCHILKFHWFIYASFRRYCNLIY